MLLVIIMTEVVEVLIPGGQADPGPPLGPAMGPLGVNVKEVVDMVNEKTKEFNGMQVPVKIIIESDKSIAVEVGTPPTSAIIKQELGVEKGVGDNRSEVLGDLTMEQVVKIGRMKKDSLLSYNVKNAVKEILGTCLSIGATVDGKPAREVQRMIDDGTYDEVLTEQ